MDKRTKELEMLDELMSSGVRLSKDTSAVSDSPAEAKTTGSLQLESEAEAYLAMGVYFSHYDGTRLYNTSDEASKIACNILRLIKGYVESLKFNTPEVKLESSIDRNIIIEGIQVHYDNNPEKTRKFNTRVSGNHATLFWNKMQCPTNKSWSNDGLDKTLLSYFCMRNYFVETSDKGMAKKLLESTGLTVKMPAIEKVKELLVMRKGKNMADIIELKDQKKTDQVLADRWKYTNPAQATLMSRAEEMYVYIEKVDRPEGFPTKTELPDFLRTHPSERGKKLVGTFNHQIPTKQLWDRYPHPDPTVKQKQLFPCQESRAATMIPFWRDKLGFESMGALLHHKIVEPEITGAISKKPLDL